MPLKATNNTFKPITIVHIQELFDFNEIHLQVLSNIKSLFYMSTNRLNIVGERGITSALDIEFARVNGVICINFLKRLSIIIF